jgi:hypothetical protein
VLPPFVGAAVNTTGVPAQGELEIETLGTTTGLITNGMPEVVAEAEVVVKHAPVRPVTSSVTTSPGLKVLGPLVSVLTGNELWLAVENWLPFNFHEYEPAVCEEVKTMVSPVQKFILLI